MYITLKNLLIRNFANRLGLIIEDVSVKGNDLIKVLHSSREDKYKNNIFYVQFQTFLLAANLFGPKVDNLYTHSEEVISNSLSNLEKWNHILYSNNIKSTEGSMVTYKGKMVDILKRKPANFTTALRFVEKEFSNVNVLEVGFNIGYGAYSFLSTIKNLSYTGVDICLHKSVIPASKLISKMFPKNDISFVYERSQNALEKLVEAKKMFNFIHIDGSHSYNDVKVDLILSDKLLEKKRDINY